MFFADSLSQMLTDVSGVPANGVLEFVVGDAALNFAPTAGTVGSTTLTKVRAPASSVATVSGTTFTPDVPGLYTFTLTNGNATRGLTVLCFPAAALNIVVDAGSGRTFSRSAMRALANDPRVTATTSAASLELANPGAAGSATGVDGRLVGLSASQSLNLRQYMAG